jgi:hypothetical protein
MNAITLKLPAGQEEAFWRSCQQVVLVGDAFGSVLTAVVTSLRLCNKIGKINWEFLHHSDLVNHLVFLVAARLLQMMLILLARPVYYRCRISISIALKAFVVCHVGPEMLRRGLQQMRADRAILWLGVNGKLQGYISLSRALLLPTGVYLLLFEVFEYFKMPFRWGIETRACPYVLHPLPSGSPVVAVLFLSFRAWLPLQLLWALRVVPATWPLAVRLVGLYDGLVQKAHELCDAMAEGVAILAGLSTAQLQDRGSGDGDSSLTRLVLATQLVGAAAAPSCPPPLAGGPRPGPPAPAP